MRAIAACAMLAAACAGCLRSAEFRCLRDSECGAAGVCESIGYCSVPNAACAGTGRSFSDSAGQNLSNTCVPGENPGPGPDAGVDVDAAVDAAIDGPVIAGCPSSYAPIAGSAHVYKALSNVSWDEAASQCRAAGAAYLAVPDDAAELANLATVASAPFWIGLDDKATEGTFVTQKNAAATFLPWKTGEPDDGPPAEDCVNAVSAIEIATDRCGSKRSAVCECEP
jgi:hypothetical protein